MSIAYPRALPSSKMLDVYFEPEPQEAFAPEQGGRFVSTELGPPLWVARFATTPASEEEFSLWRAWLSSLRGAGRLFYGYDMRRPRPWRYRRGFVDDAGEPLLRAVSGTAFDGTTTAWSVNAERDEITLGDASGQELPAALTLIPGDYIGLRKDALIRSVHRVLEAASADASGVGAWIVEPEVHGAMPADASVTLIKPDVAMAITKRDGPEASHISRRVGFEARQHMEF